MLKYVPGGVLETVPLKRAPLNYVLRVPGIGND